MKFYIFLLLGLLSLSKAHAQDQKGFLMGFFVSGFNNDSVHVFLNDKKIMAVKLTANPSLGQCDEIIMAKLSDSAQSLTIFEVNTQKEYQTNIKKGFKYLYMYKLKDGHCQFEYSNKLSLPE
jgi:hypothetical protein